MAFITAIVGGYEARCPEFAKQTIAADFICFTDSTSAENSKNGWIVDNYSYHLDEGITTAAASGDYSDAAINSLRNNNHSFNVAKFYKSNFYLFPCLSQYETIIWIEGTISIKNKNTARIITQLVESGEHLILFEKTHTSMAMEVQLSHTPGFSRYTGTFWFDQRQPAQDIVSQYELYLQLGYDESKWKSSRAERPYYGMWVTCFVVFHIKSPKILDFLKLWYRNLKHISTQDQVSFPFVSQQLDIYPHSLPDDKITGNFRINSLYSKNAVHSFK